MGVVLRAAVEAAGQVTKVGVVDVVVDGAGVAARRRQRSWKTRATHTRTQ